MCADKQFFLCIMLFVSYPFKQKFHDPNGVLEHTVRGAYRAPIEGPRHAPQFL